MHVTAHQPLGPPRLVRAVEERATRPVRGVAQFATAGTLRASATAMNPMLGGRKQMADVAARAAHSGLPQVVGLAVDDEGVDVYPVTWNGHVVGDAISRWDKGTFSATTFRRPLVIQLGIIPSGGEHLKFETKTFPVGVNRHNAVVARMILAMSAAERPRSDTRGNT